MKTRTEMFWFIERTHVSKRVDRRSYLLWWTCSWGRRAAWDLAAANYADPLQFRRLRRKGVLRAVKIAVTWEASR